MKNFKNWLAESTEPFIKSYTTNDTIELSYSDPIVKGYLHAQKDIKNPQIYRVIRVTVNPTGQGYGKKLYIAAIKTVSQKGATLAPAANSTSDSAFNIWKSLYSSNDFQKIPLEAKDWPDSPRNHKMMKKYPNLRFNDVKSYPPKEDVEFWAFNSSYKIN